MSTLKLSLVGFVSRLVATGLTVVTTLVLARYLGPGPTGQYFLFLRVIALLAVFADLGFSQSANVFAGRGESVRQVHGIVVRFSIVMSAVLLVVFFVLLTVFGPRVLPNYPRDLQIATFICVPLFVYSNLWNFLMIGLGQIWTMNIVQVTSAFVSLVLITVAVIGFSQGLAAAAAIYAAVLVLQVLIMISQVVRLTRGRSDPHRDGLFAEMWRFGLRGSGGSISAILWPRIPVFVLNVFRGAAAVGIFSVGQQLVEKMLLPIQATQEAIYRRMAQAEPAHATAAMNRYIRISGWSMLLFFAACALALPLVVVTALGERYRAAVPIILILVPAALLMSVSLLLATFFLAQLRRPGLLSILALINVALIAVAAFLFVPRYGAIGAAIAVGSTQIIGTLVVIVLYLRATGARAVDLLRVSREDRNVFLQQLRDIVWLRSVEQ